MVFIIFIEKSILLLHKQMGNFIGKIDTPFVDKFNIDKAELAVVTNDFHFLA